MMKHHSAPNFAVAFAVWAALTARSAYAARVTESVNGVLTYVEGYGALALLCLCTAAILVAALAPAGTGKRDTRFLLLIPILLMSLLVAVALSLSFSSNSNEPLVTKSVVTGDVHRPAFTGGAVGGRTIRYNDKPVIYLYPERATDVAVKIGYRGELTVTYPPYDGERGWRVKAFPDGKLIDHADGRSYSYLFWEGIVPADLMPLPDTGFIVRGEESARFLQDLLERAGLSPAEYNELIVYWYPKIKEFPFVQISLAGPEYDAAAPLEISPAPDSILRVFVHFKKLAAPIAVAAPTLRGFERRGFTVVEWGGGIVE